VQPVLLLAIVSATPDKTALVSLPMLLTMPSPVITTRFKCLPLCKYFKKLTTYFRPFFVHKLLSDAIDKFHLSARAYHRILKVARTIADLDNSNSVNIRHLSRCFLVKYWLMSILISPITCERKLSSLSFSENTMPDV
jgi:hypothetical protein